jgi:Flp pilus assembly protein TadG
VVWKFSRRLCRRTDGGAAVEFGIIFPFFAVLVLGLAEYGMVMFQFMNVSHASQVGANYAMLNGFNPANIKTAVTNATGIPAGNITVAETCGCATGTAIAATSCGPPLPACGNGLTAGAYVTVTVTRAYSPAAPGIPSPLTAATLVRVLQ